MLTLAQIRASLADRVPPTIEGDGLSQAAVALMLREVQTGGLELFFIERSRREDDPWSGHMAFPGGRLEDVDRDSRATAERETLEEVGISLDTAEYLGKLTDLQGSPRFRQNRLVVSSHVYHTNFSGSLMLDSVEVASALWFPVDGLLDPANHVSYRTPETGTVDYPGIQVGEPGRHVVWGLTYSFLEIFFETVGCPLPDRSVTGWPSESSHS